MTGSIKTGWSTGIVVSLTAAALAVPAIALGGPGCMQNQRMTQGYHPYGFMAPQAAYGPRMAYPYSAAPAPYAGMMAAPYGQPLPAQRSAPVVAAAQASTESAKDLRAEPSRAAADKGSDVGGDNVTVRIDGMRFEPAEITVAPGTTVTWVHGSRMPHTINGDAEGMRSSTLYNGQTFSYTFDEAGDYQYVCGLHPSMKGSVVVKDGGAAS